MRLSVVCSVVKSLQSTSPARGKTPRSPDCLAIYTCFNPLPPRGGRPSRPRTGWSLDSFNPLPPRGGRHGKSGSDLLNIALQSTSPARGKTAKNTTNSMKVLFVFVYYFYFIQISRNSILLFVYLLYKYTIYFWCESLWNTMCTSGSHYA